MRFILLTLLSVFAALQVSATTWWVTNTQDLGPGSLRDAIILASAHDTVRFDTVLLAGGNDTILLNSPITITVPLVVKGLYNSTDSILISGQNSQRIFNVQSATSPLLLDSLVLIEGEAGFQNGGAVEAIGCDSLLLHNLVVRSCSAQYGGGIFLDTANYLEVINSQFQFNDGIYGGGLFVREANVVALLNSELLANDGNLGAGLETQQVDSIRLEGSLVADNTGGSGIRAIDPVWIAVDNSSFLRNQVNTGGGFLADVTGSTALTVQINNSTFSENQAGTGSGFSIELDPAASLSFDMDSSVFERNDADFSGAGFEIGGGSQVVTITNCLIDSNQAGSAAGISIGADDTCRLTIHNSAIQRNRVVGFGTHAGGLWFFAPYGEVTLSGQTHIDSNYAVQDGGGMRLQSTWLDLTVTDSCVFEGDSAGSQGGAMFILAGGGNINITGGTEIHGNFAQSQGGGIYTTSASALLSINNTSITNNAVSNGLGPNDPAGAGVMVTSFTAELEIDSSLIAFNHAILRDGGGIAVFGDSTVDVRISHTTLAHNQSGRNGGGLYVSNVGSGNIIHAIDLEVQESVIDDNRCAESGGGIYVSQTSGSPAIPDITIGQHTSISHNVAGEFGGGILIDRWSTITIEDSVRIVGDSAGNDGGGIHAHGYFTMTNGCVVDSNYADGEGGGMWLEGQGFGVLEDVFLRGNVAEQLGGALYFNGFNVSIPTPVETYLTLDQAIVENNQAFHGGGIYSFADSVVITNSLIQFNQADSNQGWGGGVGTRSYRTRIENTEILNNYAGGLGGGIWCIELLMDSCLVRNNHTDGNGGGIQGTLFSLGSASGALAPQELEVYHSIIDSNTAGGRAGGIGARALVIKNSQVNENEAGSHGGGIHCLYEDNPAIIQPYLRADSCEIRNNFSGEHGGGIYVSNRKSAIATSGLSRAEVEIDLEQTTVDNNTALGNGGGIFAEAEHAAFVSVTNPLPVVNSTVNLLRSTISNNQAGMDGGGLYSRSYRAATVLMFTTFFSNRVQVDYSTITNNYTPGIGGAIYATTSSPTATDQFSYVESESIVRLKGSTVYDNTADSLYGAIYNFNPGDLTDPDILARIVPKSSIIGNNGTNSIFNSEAQTIISQLDNVFEEAPVGLDSTLDQYWVDTTQINLGPLQNNGGFTETRLPLPGSVAINAGTAQDQVDAQNGPIIGVRDAGAAESGACGNYQVSSTTGCDSYTWAQTGATYTSSGTYTDTLQNQSGCDSVLILNLQVFSTSGGTDTVSACNAYFWPASGTTYLASGSYSAVVPNANGCDSTIALELTIFQATSGTETVSSCEPYLWPANGQTYSNTGSYVTTLTNSVGCDSVATLDLTINAVDTMLVQQADSLVAMATGASYQWFECSNGFTPLSGDTMAVYQPTSNGTYAVVITQNGCVDTSRCVDVLNVGITAVEELVAPVVYPNPSRGQISVFLPAGQRIQRLEIRAQTGQLIFTQNQLLEPGTHQLNTPQLPAGVYILHLHGASQMYQYSLVVLE